MSVRANAERIREALRCGHSGCSCARERGNVHCPHHDPKCIDQTPGLSLGDKGGKTLWKCFNGCSQDQVLAALKERRLWGIPSSNGQRSKRDMPLPHGQGGDKMTNSAPGLDLATLAAAKGFEIRHLQEWECGDRRQNGVTRVFIPYLGAGGETLAIRYRLALTGAQRFLWRTGNEVHLYGLNKMEAIRKAGWVLLVEGESDTWTGWMYDVPTLGIPGKSIWKADWAEFLASLDVYLWCEPDADDLILRVARDIPGLRVIHAPEGVKDLNEAHLKGNDVAELVQGLKAKAVPAEQIRRETADNEIARLRVQAAPIIQSLDPLVDIERDIRALGYGGDIKAPMVTTLAMTTRVLQMKPGGMLAHILLLGPPSAGKSYAVQTALRLLPEDACVNIEAGSPRTLIYNDADLRHKVVIFGEADSLPSGEDNPAASAIRNLLQDGHLHYDVTIRDSETGDWTVRKVRKEGPTVLVTTAVQPLGAQLMSRLFTLDVAGDAGQIRAALTAQASAETQGTAAPNPALVDYQAYLQALAPWSVVIPFVKELADAIAKGSSAPRVLRDFQRLLSLIKAVAVLRHPHRATDAQGRLVADVADYATVYDLVAEMYAASVTGVTEGVTNVVTKVRELAGTGTETKISYSVLAKELNVHRDLVRRRAAVAIRNGWLVNRETRHNHQADLAAGDPLPENEGLPKPEEVCHLVTTLTDETMPMPAQHEEVAEWRR